ncbi:hypothetical protein FKM82_028413 [Ascaphus truei]
MLCTSLRLPHMLGATRGRAWLMCRLQTACCFRTFQYKIPTAEAASQTNSISVHPHVSLQHKHSSPGASLSLRAGRAAPWQCPPITASLNCLHKDARTVLLNRRCRYYSSSFSTQAGGEEEKTHGRAKALGKELQETTNASKPDLASQDARRLLALAYPERWRLSAALGFLTVSSVITMSAPFFLGKVIDVIYANPTGDLTSSLTNLCALLSGVFLCGAAANATRVYLMQTSGQRIVQRLRSSLFSSVLRQEVGFFDKTRTGELINRLSSDTSLLGRSVTENLSDGLRAVAQASVGVGMMFFVSPQLATFVLSVVPPLAIVAVIYGRYLRKLTRLTQDSLAEATQLAEERIGNIRTVRAFGKEMLEMEKYTSKVDYVLYLAKKEALARAGFFGITGLSGNLIVLSVLYKGGLLMGASHMTVGELSSFLMYAFWVGISIGGMWQK